MTLASCNKASEVPTENQKKKQCHILLATTNVVPREFQENTRAVQHVAHLKQSNWKIRDSSSTASQDILLRDI